VNPVSALLWMIPAALMALVLWLFLGWTWWASLGVGVLLVPPAIWVFSSVLDRLEQEPAQPPGGSPTYEVVPETQLKLERPNPCPACGSPESATLLYGQPALTDELKTAMELKKVVLAGCPVYEGAPLWLCPGCGTGHGKIFLT